MRLLLIILSLLPLLSVAQKPITIGSQHTIWSSVLQEEREYWVHLPESYDNENSTQDDYPVLYITDGDRNFLSTIAAQNDLSRGLYQHMPEAIIVAILNTERSRDLTPTLSKVLYQGKELHTNSGGAKAFHHFLYQELKSKIDSTYRTNGYNVLMGHSFGGLFTLYTLIEHPQSFNAYIAHDPSVWWDDNYILTLAQKKWNTLNLKGRSLYISKAYNEQSERLAMNHPVAIEKFCDLLTDTTHNQLRARWHYFANEDHGTIVAPATYQAFKYIFEGYCLPVKKIPDHPQLVEESFHSFSDKIGFHFKPSTKLLKELADYCLSCNKPESAESLLLLQHKSSDNQP